MQVDQQMAAITASPNSCGNWPNRGVGIRSFAQMEPTLEDVFMLVTKGLAS